MNEKNELFNNFGKFKAKKVKGEYNENASHSSLITFT
jgi:hypothetical protein